MGFRWPNRNRWFSQRTNPPFMVGIFHGYVSHNQMVMNMATDLGCKYGSWIMVLPVEKSSLVGSQLKWQRHFQKGSQGIETNNLGWIKRIKRNLENGITTREGREKWLWAVKIAERKGGKREGEERSDWNRGSSIWAAESVFMIDQEKDSLPKNTAKQRWENKLHRLIDSYFLQPELAQLLCGYVLLFAFHIPENSQLQLMSTTHATLPMWSSQFSELVTICGWLEYTHLINWSSGGWWKNSRLPTTLRLLYGYWNIAKVNVYHSRCENPWPNGDLARQPQEMWPTGPECRIPACWTQSGTAKTCPKHPRYPSNVCTKPRRTIKSTNLQRWFQVSGTKISHQYWSP